MQHIHYYKSDSGSVLELRSKHDLSFGHTILYSVDGRPVFAPPGLVPVVRHSGTSFYYYRPPIDSKSKEGQDFIEVLRTSTRV